METRTPTTYRRHERPAALNAVRDDLARRVAGIVGRRNLSATAIRQGTGFGFTSSDLYRLREGDLSCLSDNRLMVLAEWLGLKLTLTVAEPATVH